jgi:hypothetical protein
MNEAHGFATSCLEQKKKGQERLPLAPGSQPGRGLSLGQTVAGILPS